MLDWFLGLGGLGVIVASKIKASNEADEREWHIQNWKKTCQNFYLKFVDVELESKLIDECRSEENIRNFELTCREIGISSKHENITDFHRVIILLLRQNKLPVEWFYDRRRWLRPDEHWYYAFDGFNFIWNDPNDVYATTKLLCYVNKMIHSNNSDVNILVLDREASIDGGHTVGGCKYRYLDSFGRKDEIVQLVVNKRYKWDCVLTPTEKIIKSKY